MIVLLYVIIKTQHIFVHLIFVGLMACVGLGNARPIAPQFFREPSKSRDGYGCFAKKFDVVPDHGCALPVLLVTFGQVLIQL